MLSKIQILIEIQLDDTVSSVYLSPACFLYIALMTEFHSSVSNGDNVDINDDDDDDDDDDEDGDNDDEDEDVYDAQFAEVGKRASLGQLGEVN